MGGCRSCYSGKSPLVIALLLGQARHIFKLGNVFYIIYYLKVIQQSLNYHNYEHFEEEPHKSDWYIYPAILPVTDIR